MKGEKNFDLLRQLLLRCPWARHLHWASPQYEQLHKTQSRACVDNKTPHEGESIRWYHPLSVYSLYVFCFFFTIHHISCRTSVCFPLSSITVIMKNQPLLHNDTVVWFSLQRHIVLTHISALRAFKQTNRIKYSRLNTTVSDVQVLHVWRRIQSQDYSNVPVFLEHLKICVTKQHNITLSGEKCMEAKTAWMCYNFRGSATPTRLCMQIRTNFLSLTHFAVSKMCFNNVNPYSVQLQWLGPSTKHYFEFGFIVVVIFQAICWTRAGSSFFTCWHSWKCIYSYL